MLVCTTKTIAVYTLPLLERVSLIDVGRGILWAKLLYLNDAGNEEGCLVIIDEKQNILLYSLFDLQPILVEKQIRIPDEIELKAEDILLTSCCIDGDLIFLSNNQMFRMTLFPQVTGDTQAPCVCLANVIVPPKKEKPTTRNFLSSLLSQSSQPQNIDFDSLFTAMPKDVEQEQSQVPSETNVTPKKTLTSESQKKTDQIESLSTSKKTEKLSSTYPKNSKSDKLAPRHDHTNIDKKTDINSQRDVRAAKLSEVQNTLNENLQLLNERGDRIKELGEKTQELNNESATLVANARRLRQMYEAKKWYEL